MICYSNDGFSFRFVDEDYVAQEGEVLFTDYATEEQLRINFPNRVIILKKQALDALNMEYATKLAEIARDFNKPALFFEPGDPQIAINEAAMSAEYKATAAELLIKREVILNG